MKCGMLMSDKHATALASNDWAMAAEEYYHRPSELTAVSCNMNNSSYEVDMSMLTESWMT